MRITRTQWLEAGPVSDGSCANTDPRALHMHSNSSTRRCKVAVTDACKSSCNLSTASLFSKCIRLNRGCIVQKVPPSNCGFQLAAVQEGNDKGLQCKGLQCTHYTSCSCAYHLLIHSRHSPPPPMGNPSSSSIVSGEASKSVGTSGSSEGLGMCSNKGQSSK